MLETPESDPLKKNQVFLPLYFFFIVGLEQITSPLFIYLFIFYVRRTIFWAQCLSALGCINNRNGSPLVLGVFNLNYAFMFTYFVRQYLLDDCLISLCTVLKFCGVWLTCLKGFCNP